ncbi:hypothetical protein PP187_gp043 [Klebsiella phage vB_KvM-Eowyn]|uniref:Ammonia monooxygenase n=1 Tax=Klebsiella phage vB_KvM-Eowyn TaxID=2762819 RepID=A0A7R8MJA4_9CAUD|nr:hypothetical protein PP187_gp043 [Klebsiella phage vB_KvM-Eowyn]CAD5236032.1 hypothetical protein LLCLJKAH_00043 [Klebsiella phage vB_KvM-Eowyn]
MAKVKEFCDATGKMLGYTFMCVGCGYRHQVRAGGTTQPQWLFNGDVDKPTFQPSVLVTWTEPSDNPDEFDNPAKDINKVCHSFITDGKIQYLGDCTHRFAGQTLDLPEVK